MPIYRKGNAWRVVVYVGGVRKDLICKGTEQEARELHDRVKHERLTVLSRPDLWTKPPRAKRSHQELLTIYFIQSGDGGPIKIGIAFDVSERMGAMQTGNPEPLRLLATIPGRKNDERQLHHVFRHLSVRGEWFSPAEDLLAHISDLGKDGQEKLSHPRHRMPIAAFHAGIKPRNG